MLSNQAHNGHYSRGGGGKDIFLSEIIFWMHVTALFSVCLTHDTDDTMVYFQKKVFSLELAYKIMFFKCCIQWESMVIFFSISGIKNLIQQQMS